MEQSRSSYFRFIVLYVPIYDVTVPSEVKSVKFVNHSDRFWEAELQWEPPVVDQCISYYE